MNKLETITTILTKRLMVIELDSTKQINSFKASYVESLEGLGHNEPLQHDAIEHLLICHGDTTIKTQRKIQWLNEWINKLNTWDMPEWADGMINSLANETDANMRRYKADIVKRVFTIAY